MQKLIITIASILLMTGGAFAQSDQLANTRPNGTICRDFDPPPTAYEDPDFWINNAQARLRDGDYAFVVENIQPSSAETAFMVACGLWGLGRDGEAEDMFLNVLEMTDDEELAEGVIALLGYDPAEREFRPVVPAPAEIDVSGDSADIMRQLEASGVIPSGGELIFTENPSLTTTGTNFDTYGMQAGADNFVMGATLNFDAQSNDLETCGIGGHIDRESSSRITGFNGTGFSSQVTISLDSYLIVVVGSDGALVLIEQQNPSASPQAIVIEDAVDVSEPIDLTVVALDLAVNVYANGELLIETDIEHSRGGWAFILNSGAQSTRCSATDFFAYQIPDHYVFDMCQISSFGTVNLRSGPSTSFDRAGQLAFGDVLEAVAQAEDTSGFTWWQLDTGAWVREDVITADGDCRTLPIAEA